MKLMCVCVQRHRLLGDSAVAATSAAVAGQRLKFLLYMV